MKVKLVVICFAVIGYLVLVFGSEADGVNPPHAVDISGKVIPESSIVQPDKPIILANDSDDKSRGPLKREAAFDHAKHSTDIAYSLDGKTVTTCAECHHTDQPSAPNGQEYLKKFSRSEILTAKHLETSKQPVNSCRACHFKASTEPNDESPPEGVVYPKKTGKRPTGTLTNDVAYHINCNTCHDAIKAKNPKSKAPSDCYDCHVKK
jgi:hypothetical protein